ncbi:MAG: PilZ domain-containing protein [Nitrospirota bacterium]
MPNRRAFQRFDIFTVLEFRLLTAAAGTFAGITRNFSYEGLCLETQCVSFEMGDSLELMLKHPHSEAAVNVPAYVVWKKTADKFASLMGLKLVATELDTRLRMLEIMSAAGEVPVDSFLSGGGEQEIEPPELDYSYAETGHAMTEIPVQQSTETKDDGIEQEKSDDEGPLIPEVELSNEKSPGSAFDEVLKTVESEDQQQAEEVPVDEPVESDMPWPRHKSVEDETAHAPGVGSRVLKQLMEHRMITYSSVAAVILVISAYAFFSMSHRRDSIINPPPAVRQQEEQHITKAADSEPFQQEVSAVLSEQDDDRVEEEQLQYVQIGAWRNIDNAREMLQKVRKYYPEAYMTEGKKLNKVKIPASNKTETMSIIKDIEDRFQLKPLVTSER